LRVTSLVWICIFAVLVSMAYIGAISRENYLNGTSNKTVDDYTNTLQQSETNITNTFTWHFNTTSTMDFTNRFTTRTKNVVGAFASFVSTAVFETGMLGFEYGWYHLSEQQGRMLWKNAIIILYICIGIVALPGVFYLLALIIIIILGIKNWVTKKSHETTQAQKSLPKMS